MDLGELHRTFLVVLHRYVFFTFTDTDYFPIPVTDMPIFTDILQFFRTEEEEQKIT